MSEFKREERFIVIKRKHLSAESRTHDSLEQELRVWLDRHLVPTSECVVVESDWPEYEAVWAMLAARVEGRPTPYQVLEQQIAALRQHKTDYMEAAEGTRKALEAEAKVLRTSYQIVCEERKAIREEVAALRARVVVVPDAGSQRLLVSELVSLAAGLACRRPLSRMAELCDEQSRVTSARLLGYIDEAGDSLADYAVDLRRIADELARLNGKAVSEGLLRRVIDHLDWDGKQEMTAHDYVSRGDKLADELRNLLGEGKEHE